MTKDEALKLALEALEDLIEAGAEDWSEQRPCVRIGREVATAIKAALAQPEQCPDHLDGTHVFDEHGQCYGTDCKALAQPAQPEPYAWFWSHGSDSGVLTDAQDYEHYKKTYAAMTFTPVFTAAPKRQPLTDEEIDCLWLDSRQPRNECPYDFARAIEQAHGIGDKT
jgi:hypothetical protein